ncbi:hypothetical protein [uncultured Bilophila sp.]|uniref:hypothetical protein n=1 Tax=uncultured Bilophila sp. TaxID=529385 RepID=UPI00280B28BB|nr:hypothetical protein [uncultured Bilophila sp.]
MPRILRLSQEPPLAGRPVSPKAPSWHAVSYQQYRLFLQFSVDGRHAWGILLIILLEWLCYRKWLMLFSLKLQRDNRKNALDVDPAKGKTGKKALFFTVLWR